MASFAHYSVDNLIADDVRVYFCSIAQLHFRFIICFSIGL
jgi:hypothetical protein